MGGKPLAGQFFIADKEAENEDHQRCAFSCPMCAWFDAYEISRLDGYDEGFAISENISDAEKIYQNY